MYVSSTSGEWLACLTWRVSVAGCHIEWWPFYVCWKSGQKSSNIWLCLHETKVVSFACSSDFWLSVSWSDSDSSDCGQSIQRPSLSLRLRLLSDTISDLVRFVLLQEEICQMWIVLFPLIIWLQAGFVGHNFLFPHLRQRLWTTMIVSSSW